MIVRGRISGAWLGSSKPNALSRACNPMATNTPRIRPITEESTPDEQRLGGDRARDLLAAGADRAQQRELPRPLRHDDREGVVDDERTDEQGDEREHQQEGVEEAQPLLDVVGGLVGDLLAR